MRLIHLVCSLFRTYAYHSYFSCCSQTTTLSFPPDIYHTILFRFRQNTECLGNCQFAKIDDKHLHKSNTHCVCGQWRGPHISKQRQNTYWNQNTTSMWEGLIENCELFNLVHWLRGTPFQFYHSVGVIQYVILGDVFSIAGRLTLASTMCPHKGLSVVSSATLDFSLNFDNDEFIYVLTFWTV